MIVDWQILEDHNIALSTFCTKLISSFVILRLLLVAYHGRWLLFTSFCRKPRPSNYISWTVFLDANRPFTARLMLLSILNHEISLVCCRTESSLLSFFSSGPDILQLLFHQKKKRVSVLEVFRRKCWIWSSRKPSRLHVNMSNLSSSRSEQSRMFWALITDSRHFNPVNDNGLRRSRIKEEEKIVMYLVESLSTWQKLLVKYSWRSSLF